MSFGVSYNQISMVDVNSIKEVTGQIFNRAAEKSNELEKFDLSKFNRPSQGTELYGNSVNAAQASNIAMLNSGLQVQLNQNTLNSLKYLKTQASKKAFADVTGNIALPVEEEKEIKHTPDNKGNFGKVIGISNLALDNK